MKTCRTCNQKKSLLKFYRNKGAVMPDCRDCHRERVKKRRLTDPKVREYDRVRAKLPHRKKLGRANSIKWREENPDGYKAHTAVSNALRDGKIKKQPCQVCAEEKVHAHHKDYSKPLDVIWLCARCHHRLHALFPELEGKNKRGAA